MQAPYKAPQLKTTDVIKKRFKPTDWIISFEEYGKKYEPNANYEVLWRDFHDRVKHLIRIINDSSIREITSDGNPLLSYYVIKIEHDKDKGVFSARIYIENPVKELGELIFRTELVYSGWAKAEKTYNRKVKVNKERYSLNIELLGEFYDASIPIIPVQSGYEAVTLINVRRY